MSTNNIIWMGDIRPKMTEQDIINCFLNFNIQPQSVKLIKDRKTNENKNFCFLYFKTLKEANSAIFKLNGKKIPGTKRVFRLNWASCRSSYNKSAYVGNLSPNVDDIKLFNLFKKRYPTVHHASVVTENGVSKGYGFVLFNGKEEYEKCLKEMNGINFYGKNLKVREQKKKIDKNKINENIIDNNEEDESSSSFNESEKNYDYMQYDKNIYYNNNISNNINNNVNNINNFINNECINNHLFNSVNYNNIQNNQIMNNNIINVDKNININDFENSQINNINNINSLGINNEKMIHFTDINNINDINCNYNNNKIVFNYNIAKDNICFSPVNNNINNTIGIGNKFTKKSNFSNNSIVSLNSINSELMSNYSTAEKINNQIKPKKYVLEILNPLDENALIQKMQEGLTKIYNYYKENPFHGDKKINCKFYIFNLIFLLYSIKYVSLLFNCSAFK